MLLSEIKEIEAFAKEVGLSFEDAKRMLEEIKEEENL